MVMHRWQHGGPFRDANHPLRCDQSCSTDFSGSDTGLVAASGPYPGGEDTLPTKVKVPPAKLARAVERFRYHLNRLNQRLVPPFGAIMELTLEAWVSQAVYAAAELGIADALARGPLPLNELANRVGADADALKRLMRALIGRGVFRQHRDGRYDLTPLAETLRSDAPVSTSGWARFIGSRQHREHWSLCWWNRSRPARRSFQRCAARSSSTTWRTTPSSRNSLTTP